MHHENKEKANSNVITEFDIRGSKAVVLKGKGTYPPYIQVTSAKGERRNYPIHRLIDPTKLTKKKVSEIISTKYKKPTKTKVTKKK